MLCKHALWTLPNTVSGSVPSYLSMTLRIQYFQWRFKIWIHNLLFPPIWPCLGGCLYRTLLALVVAAQCESWNIATSSWFQLLLSNLLSSTASLVLSGAWAVMRDQGISFWEWLNHENTGVYLGLCYQCTTIYLRYGVLCEYWKRTYTLSQASFHDPLLTC